MTFNVGSLGELDRIEAVLRGGDRFTSRRQIADGASELLRGRDPDNLPLVFVCYSRNPSDQTISEPLLRWCIHSTRDHLRPSGAATRGQRHLI
jgi:hypothetical protein